jgi:hypothetical protein
MALTLSICRGADTGREEGAPLGVLRGTNAEAFADLR